MPSIIIAAGPVITENNRVLLNQHGEDEFWKFCGGRVNDTEADLKEAAGREAKEEMGIDLEILDQEPYFFYAEKDVAGIKTSVVLVHFLARRLGEIKPGEDIRRWQWVDIAGLDKENLAPNILPALKHFGIIN